MSPHDGDGAGDAAELIAGAPAVVIAAPDATGEGVDRLPSQRDRLVGIADRAAYWRDEDGIAHVTIPVANHAEHHRVRSRAFRDWLTIEAGREYPIAIAGRSRPSTYGRAAIDDAIAACEAMASASGTVHPGRLRTAEHGSAIYLDIGDPEWRAIEIRPGRWRIVERAPVPILRSLRTRALPLPVAGGSLAPLRALLPLNDDDDWRVVILWLLAALRPTGPYPILAWSGEQGSGKSVASRIMRRLVDPCGDDLAAPPREDRDLIAAARHNHVVALDNVSAISESLADSLCRLATGGDIGGRALYTDYDSAAFSACRPILANGIPDLTTRGDLASRSLFVRLAPMARRRPEAEIWSAFAAAAPGIMGALLDVLAAALARLPTVRLPDDAADLRMADFALLARAAEPALGWPAGSALAAIRRNIRSAASTIADSDPVAIAIRAMLAERSDGRYDGLVSALYARLAAEADPELRRAREWPAGPRRFGEHLRRVAPALRAVGIDIDLPRRRSVGQPVTIADRAGASRKRGNLITSTTLSQKDEQNQHVDSVIRDYTAIAPAPVADRESEQNQPLNSVIAVGGMSARAAAIPGRETAAEPDPSSSGAETDYTANSLKLLGSGSGGAIACNHGVIADYTINPLKNKGENADGVVGVIRIPDLRVGGMADPSPDPPPARRRKRIVL
jgi:putative DNA primase/helicase